MAAPRIGKFSSTPIKYNDGATLFNGFLLVGLAIPTVSGTAFRACFYGNSGVAERLPVFYKVPVDSGVPNGSSGLFYNADINPPGSIYYYWAYVGGTSGVPARMLAGPSSSFSVTSETITLPALSIPLPSAGSVPDPDASSVASTSSVQVNFVFASPSQTPDGTTTVFTFSGLPQVVMYNGQMRFEGVGYSRSGFDISLLDDAGSIFPPETGASLKAIL